jgi:hypothetical protein
MPLLFQFPILAIPAILAIANRIGNRFQIPIRSIRVYLPGAPRLCGKAFAFRVTRSPDL